MRLAALCLFTAGGSLIVGDPRQPHDLAVASDLASGDLGAADLAGMLPPPPGCVFGAEVASVLTQQVGVTAGADVVDVASRGDGSAIMVWSSNADSVMGWLVDGLGKVTGSLALSCPTINNHLVAFGVVGASPATPVVGGCGADYYVTSGTTTPPNPFGTGSGLRFFTTPTGLLSVFADSFRGVIAGTYIPRQVTFTSVPGDSTWGPSSDVAIAGQSESDYAVAAVVGTNILIKLTTLAGNLAVDAMGLAEPVTPLGLTALPDGNVLAVARHDGTVQLYHFDASGTAPKEIPLGITVHAAVHPQRAWAPSPTSPMSGTLYIAYPDATSFSPTLASVEVVCH